MARLINKKVLDGVIATGASDMWDSMGHPYLTMTVIASSVTSGGTVKLQGSPDGTNWVDIATRTVSADGTTADTSTGIHKYIRANLSSRTDGTYTVWLTATGNADQGGEL